MSPLAGDIIGLVGSAIFLAAFAYANLARALNKVWFNLANLAGSILLLISLSVTFNLAAFVLETAWGAIAAVGLVMALRKSPSHLREGLGVGQSDEDNTGPPPAPPASGRRK
jgi:hypothetical protein